MFKKKAILMLLGIAVVCAVLCGVAFAENGSTSEQPDDGSTVTGMYVKQIGDTTLTVNKQNLNLTIQKGGRTWYSGNRHTDETGQIDDGLNDRLGKRVSDGVYITYRNLKTSNDTQRAITDITDEPVSSFTERDDGFDAKIRLRPIGIGFTVRVRFDGTKLTVTVPGDSINETSDTTKLAQLSLYPYFDSSYGRVPGYIFIPDGSGALIDLNKAANATQGFSQRIYGEDFSMTTPTSRANEPRRNTMPVVATMYSDGGTTAVVTSGAEYARVNASVSGIGNFPYNSTGFDFIYREGFVHYYESSGTEGANYADFQTDLNSFDAQVTYTLMELKDGEDQVNIVDVADVYRDYVDINKTQIDNVGLRLQFLMAENKPSMFGRETVHMSTPDFVWSVAQDVNSYCHGLTVSLTGYQRKGLGGAAPSVFPMANKAAYRNLCEELATLDVPMNFAVDYVRIHNRASVSNSDLLQNISEQFVVLNDTRAGSSATFRLLKPSYSERSLASDLSKLNFDAGLELTNFGSMLFSGYKQESFTRSDLIERNVNAIRNADRYFALSNPNSYMFGVMDSYVDAPLENSAYLIESESVPFLQIVLGGYVPLYSQALNLDYTGIDLILRLIDCDVYPSFILTEQDAIELYGTDSQSIFTSSFDVWKYTVRNTYIQVNSVLKEVVGQQIVRRDKLDNNVYVNTYSNGTRIVVNYGNKDYSFAGTEVKAQRAIAVRQDGTIVEMQVNEG